MAAVPSRRAKDLMMRAGLGLTLGYALSRIGFSRYDEVRKMFLLEDLRMFLTFAGGVTLAALGFFALRGVSSLPPRSMHAGIVPGALLFGAGWALCGACPGIAFVQIGEGQLTAFVTLAGMFAGNWIYGAAHARYFRWDAQGCGE